jgi:hypothetical protein
MYLYQAINKRLIHIFQFQRSNTLYLENMGANSLRCTKILSLCHPFMSSSPSPFLPCKNTFMDDYDGI